MSSPSNNSSPVLRFLKRTRLRNAIAPAIVVSILGALLAIAATVSDFTQYNYDHGAAGLTSVGRDLPGMLYVPTNQVAGQKYPLVVYLHGSGDHLTSNASTLNRQVSSANLNNIVTNAKSRQFYVYAPQLYHPSNNWRIEYIDDAMKRVARAVRDHNVDLQRIYVTGLSAGGAGTYSALCEYADIFAGGVSIAGNLGSSYRVAELARRPLWIYHATNDTSGNSVTYSRQRVQDLRAHRGLPAIPGWPLDGLPTNSPYYNNGSPYYSDTPRTTFYSDAYDLRYSEYKTGNHSTNVWGRAWGESHLWDWLLSKTANPQPPLEGDLILFDLGMHTFADFDHFATDAQGRMWNSTRSTDSSTLDISVPFAKTAAGRRTTVALEVTQAFSEMDNGIRTGAPYETNMARDGWTTPVSGTSVLRLSGLAPNAPYKVSVWASNIYTEGGRPRTSRYEINSEVRDLEAYNNLTDMAVFEEVTSASDGTLDLKVYAKPGTTARVGQVNVMELLALATSETAPPDVEGAILNYSFDEEEGQILNAGSAGSPADLTLYGSAARTPAGEGISGGSTDRALSNNGSTGSRASAVSTVSGINGLTAFTITGWMKLTAWSSGRIILKQYSNWNSGLSFRLGSTGEMILSVGRSDGDSGGAQTSVGGGFDAALTDWVFFAVSWDGAGSGSADKVKFYRASGTSAPSEVSSIARAGALSTGNSTGTLSIANDGGWAAINGRMDALRLYGSVLTPTEIAQIKAATEFAAPAPLLRQAAAASISASAPVLVQAVSRQTHGPAGDFDLALPGVEPRKIAGKARVLLTFDQPISGGTVSLIGVGNVEGKPAISGRTMTVSLANVANAQTLMLDVSNVQGAGGGPVGSASVTFKVLAGDVTGDGAVTDADAEQVKAALAPDINVSNAVNDLNLSGTLNTSDVIVTKSGLGTSAL